MTFDGLPQLQSAVVSAPYAHCFDNNDDIIVSYYLAVVAGGFNVDNVPSYASHCARQQVIVAQHYTKPSHSDIIVHDDVSISHRTRGHHTNGVVLSDTTWVAITVVDVA